MVTSLGTKLIFLVLMLSSVLPCSWLEPRIPPMKAYKHSGFMGHINGGHRILYIYIYRDYIMGPTKVLICPLFTFKEDYEPFLYVLKARLAALRAMTLSFDADLASLWMKYQDVPLNENPRKFWAPLGVLFGHVKFWDGGSLTPLC